jgi:pyrroloquinoline quinone biosynthesis protein B
VCRLAWARDARVRPRTQASIAVTANGDHWVLLNASPDLKSQLDLTPALHPRGGLRSSPIRAVVLTGGEVDQIAGLLCLRERQPFTLHATAETLQLIEENSIFGVLAADLVSRQVVRPGQAFALPGAIEAELFTVPGKPPLYVEGDAPQIGGESGVSVGIEMRATGKRLVFVPGAAAIVPALKARLADADAVLFDGTLFTDDEMIRTQTGTKTGRRMGHVPIAGPGGSLAELADLGRRRIYVHINNTNPILVDRSPERLNVEAAGWEVAEDGLEIVL